MISFLASVVKAATPLLFATLGETITERSGHLNLGVEGLMLMGAVSGFLVGFQTANPFLALIMAMGAGSFGALIYAFLTVSLRANQVVSGLALTIFGTGVSSFFGKTVVGEVIPTAIRNAFKPINIPLLSKIPFVGPIFFSQDIYVYLGYLVAVLMGIYLFHTQQGLKLRAIGENPGAADASGVSVNAYKYIHILIGGALCGLGGAYLSLVYVPTWTDNITAGKGWIAVALVIFAAWNPYKAMLGAFVFGGLDIIGFRLQKYSLPISQYFIDMLPYIVTIVVLVVTSMRKNSKNNAPKSLGVAYFREDR